MTKNEKHKCVIKKEDNKRKNEKEDNKIKKGKHVSLGDNEKEQF